MFIAGVSPLLQVLKLCEEHNDQECKGDTLGVIADIYTDLGEIELAAKFYDEYIQMLYSQDEKKEESVDMVEA